MEIRPKEHALLVDGRAIEVTSREFDIVVKLAEHPGWVFSAEQLADADETGDFSPESVSVHVSHLRRKLSAAGAVGVVQTVRGVGYRIRPSDSDDAGPGDRDPSCDPIQSVRDELWRLEEAVVQLQHAGSARQQELAARALCEARREIYGLLAE